MPQTTILAAAQTAGTSTNVTVAAGTVATIGIFASTAIPSIVEIDVRQVTPAGDNFVAKLTHANQTTVISGPGVFRAYRRNISAGGVNVGVFSDT